MKLLQKLKQFIIKEHQFRITWILKSGTIYGVGAIQQKIDVVQYFCFGNPIQAAASKVKQTNSGKMYLRRNFLPGTISNWYLN